MRRTDPTHVFLKFFVFCLLLFVSIAAKAATAPAANPYIVTDIQVDIVAQSAVKAREKAFSEAQKKAFDVLVSRYLMPEDLAQFQKPDSKTIAGLVKDFEIVNEQLSTKRYKGTYIFRFKPAPSDRFFGHAPLSGGADLASAGLSSGLLILPFYQESGSQYLWDNKNIWFKAWSRALKNNGDNFILPMGDVSDLMDIQNGQATTYNPAALKRMKKRYGASDAVIILASVQSATPAQPLLVQLYRTDIKEPALGTSLTIDAAGDVNPDNLLDRAVQNTMLTLAGNWKTIAADPTVLAETAAAAAAATATANEADTVPSVLPSQQAGYNPAMPKALTASSSIQSAAQPVEQQQNFRTAVRFDHMRHWMGIRQSLNAISGLTSIKIISLNRNEAVVDLGYQGTAENLKMMLARQGLSFNADGNTGYMLTSTAIY